MSISVLEHPRAQLALTICVAIGAFVGVAVRDRDRTRHAREVSPLPIVRSDRAHAEPVAIFRGDALPTDFALSPDGSRFLVVDATGTFERRMDRETAGVRRGPPGTSVAWFGDEILLRPSEQPGFVRLGRADLAVPASERGLRDAIEALALADARTLAYVTSAGVFVRRSGEVRALYRPGAGERVSSLAFSPGAMSLAFLRQVDPSTPPALMIARCDGPSPAREVISDPRFVIGDTRLAFIAPDRLAFGMRADDGSWRLAHLAFDPSSGRLLRAPRLLSCPHRECALIGGSADATKLLIEAWDPDLDMFTARIDSDTLEGETPLAIGPGSEVPSGWSADEARVLVTSLPRSNTETSLACGRPFGCVRSSRTDEGLVLIASPGDRARRVPLPEGVTYHRIALTPDGRIALFTRARDVAALHYHRFFDDGSSRRGPAPLPTWICDPTDLEVEDDEHVLLTCGARRRQGGGLVRWAPYRDEHTILSARGRPIHHPVLAPGGLRVVYARERHAVHLYRVGIEPP